MLVASKSWAIFRSTWPMTAPMCGLILSCFIWMSKGGRRRLRACHQIISAQPGNTGETQFTDGVCRPLPVTVGGSIVAVLLFDCSILCDWITSVVSKPTGRFRAELRQQPKANGCKVPVLNFSEH